VLAVGSVFGTIGYINLNLLFGLGKPKLSSRITVATVTANVVLNAVLIPFYGIIGAAIATTASYLVMVWLSSQSIVRTVRMRGSWTAWGKTIIAAAVFVAIIAAEKSFLALNPWLELIIGCVLGGIVYLLALFFLRVITKGELIWLIEHFLKRKEA
jgi:O-antigen/teichoic acid export membrane protein